MGYFPLCKEEKMKQITIYDLLPLLKKGYVAMDNNGNWWWYKSKPRVSKRYKSWKAVNGQNMKLNTFEKKDISPFDGDWKDSLIKVEHKEEE